jgi:hypothetical protein
VAKHCVDEKKASSDTPYLGGRDERPRKLNLRGTFVVGGALPRC